MAIPIDIRPLEKRDDRSTFTCGVGDLDRYFRHYAGQNHFKLRVAITYVAVLQDRIVGFATVAVGSLERKRLPPQKLLRRLPGYPLPILRLARLGVATESQGNRVGEALLRHVLGLAIDQSEALGCIGVVADAKPEAVHFYEKYGFIKLDGVHEGLLHGDPVPMFLSLDTIITALRK